MCKGSKTPSINIYSITEICGMSHLKAAEYPFCSITCGTFTKMALTERLQGRGAGSTIISLEGEALSAPSSPLPRSFGSPRELQSAPSLPDRKGRRGPSLHTIPSPQLPSSSSQPTPWRRSGQERMRWWNEMVFIHHQLNGHEFEQTHGDREGQGSLAFFSPQGHKEFNMT